MPEFKNEQPFIPEMTVRCAERLFDGRRCLHVADRVKKTQDSVERGRRNIESPHVLSFETDIATPVTCLLPGAYQHVLRNVGTHDIVTQLLQFDCVAAGSAGNI